MNNSYKELIEQSYDFPQEGFDLVNNVLQFNGVDLSKLIKKYGTPFRLTYLPKIPSQITKARTIFDSAIKNLTIQGVMNSAIAPNAAILAMLYAQQ